MLDDADDARQLLVRRLIDGLAAAADGSAVLLRGSLAAGCADVYSDIDLLWEIPDADFPACVSHLATILATIQPVASVRSDPDFQLSDRRRLFFVRFHGVPVFWRLDLDMYARSLKRDSCYDVANPGARGTDWSWAESALTSVVAAVKAHRRGRDELARDLLRRARKRVGLPQPAASLRDTMLEVVLQCLEQEPRLAAFGSEVLALVRHGMPDANDRLDTVEI